jgi:hypothetical protein
MLSQCSKCGLSKSTGPMGSVLPQCQCDWKMPNSQRKWIGLTDEEENEYNYLGPDMHWVIQEIAAKLKERNA